MIVRLLGISALALALTEPQSAAGAEAPVKVACTETGELDARQPWVLSRKDHETEGPETYALEVRSAWASKQNSEYCLRWQIELNECKNGDTHKDCDSIRNVWWKDISLYKPQLDRGAPPTTVEKEPELKHTPIDQDTDVTGGVKSHFSLAAYLPRAEQASAGDKGAEGSVEVIKVGTETQLGDLVTRFAEGENSVSVRSVAQIIPHSSEVYSASIGIDVQTSKAVTVKFPFVWMLLNKVSVGKMQKDKLDYTPVKLPVSLKDTHTEYELKQTDNRLFVVQQPVIIDDPGGVTCMHVSVYSPAIRSYGRTGCE